jgi:hypothetical protein
MAAVAATLAVVVAACGGSGNDETGIASIDDVAAASPGETTVTTVADAEAAMLAFAECMREQGIDMQDPQVGEDGNLRMPRPVGAGEGTEQFDREAMMAAREACSVHLEGVAQRFEQFDQTEIQDQMLSYAACMRENGYDMPDPDFTTESAGGGPGRGFFRNLEIDRGDPAFQAANEVCMDVFSGGFLPGGGLGGGGQGGTPPPSGGFDGTVPAPPSEDGSTG